MKHVEGFANQFLKQEQSNRKGPRVKLRVPAAEVGQRPNHFDWKVAITINFDSEERGKKSSREGAKNQEKVLLEPV